MPPSNPPIAFTEPQVTLLVDASAPAVTPWKIKQLYIDKLTGNVWQSQGLENTSWVLVYTYAEITQPLKQMQRVTLTGEGSPVGIFNAWFPGQLYKDITTGGMWRSTGLEKEEWVFLPSIPLEQVLVVSELGSALGTLVTPLATRTPEGYEFVCSLKGLVTVTFDPNTGESGVWRGYAEVGEWFLLIPGLTANDPPLGTFVGESEDSYFVVAYAA